MKPIPTEYSGVWFRSKLEANWAEWFTLHDIIWGYEIQGFDFNDGTRYLPDFYLPEINTIIEVKGAMENIDKPYKFYEEIRDRIYKKSLENWSESQFDNNLGLDREGYAAIMRDNAMDCGELMMLLAGPVPHFYNIDPYYDNIWLKRCRECGKICFVSSFGSWHCKACGAHDGDKGVYSEEKMNPPLQKPLEWIKLEG